MLPRCRYRCETRTIVQSGSYFDEGILSNVRFVRYTYAGLAQQRYMGQESKTRSKAMQAQNALRTTDEGGEQINKRVRNRRDGGEVIELRYGPWRTYMQVHLGQNGSEGWSLRKIWFNINCIKMPHGHPSHVTPYRSMIRNPLAQQGFSMAAGNSSNAALNDMQT